MANTPSLREDGVLLLALWHWFFLDSFPFFVHHFEIEILED